MFKKKPILRYESGIEIYPDIITPAKDHIPEWYKKIPKWKNNKIVNTEDNTFQHSIKYCMPFLDSLTSGYMVTLPNDIYVEKNDNGPYIAWKNSKFPTTWRNEITDKDLVPKGHYPIEFIWNTGVAQTVPLGYSMLLTHPLNRFDLPFTTLSAIVDGGLVMNTLGNVPFYIKKDFEGIIPKGTPIMQIIPFFQQNWLSKKTKGLVKRGNEHNEMGMSLISGWYKKTFWIRKKYE
jgi:hypothetical protein